MAIKFCQNLLPSLEDSVLAKLTCPMCKEYMFQPVFHCERGHSYCEKCYKTIKLCQFCGSQTKNYRSHFLERIFEHLRYPCKFAAEGCQKRCHPKKLFQHQEECQTVIMACPFKEEIGCSFSGTRRQIVFHCQLLHGSMTFVSERIFKQPLLAKTCQASFFYNYKDILVKSIFTVQQSSIQLSMCRISPKSEMDEEYEFIITFYRKNGNIVATLKAKCSTIEATEAPLQFGDVAKAEVALDPTSCYFTLEFQEILTTED